MDAPPAQYVKTRDGYDIAYTVSGTGEPFVFMPSGVSHVQLTWSGSLGPWLRSLAERFRLVHFDSRGQGLSTRGLPAEFPFSDFMRDLDAVAGHLGLDRFVLLGSNQFSHIAVRYALERPERVRALILVHAAVSMQSYPIPLWQDVARDNWEFFLQTISLGTDSMPNAVAVERFRQMTTQADWLTSVNAFSSSDIAGLLPRLTTPTLVLHARDFPHLQVEDATRLAALIPNARLCITDGGEAFTRLEQALPAIEAFLAESPPQATSHSLDAVDGLSERELEVLRLLALGKSNPEIARDLFITRNTVQNHVSSILTKTNLTNRAQAAVYAKEHGIV